MVRTFEELSNKIRVNPQTWLVTGAAGFIGSNLVEYLLKMNQIVVGLDNFSTGHKKNLNEIKEILSPDQWKNFTLIEGDICQLDTCVSAVKGVNHVLHQAALGSVPRSIQDPILTNKSNIDGFLNMIVAAKNEKVSSFTYAASSSTYGDHPDLPKVEEIIGKPLSPYAVTKLVNELYADVFSSAYSFHCIGLRYFNVFGKRQDPDGAYAAVIPKWTAAMIHNEDILVNGDGETSRDFCYVENVIEANILASFAPGEARNQVYNVALGDQTTLNKLFEELKHALAEFGIKYDKKPLYKDFRKGDVRHSRACIKKAAKYLGYEPQYKFSAGIKLAMNWYTSKM